MLICSFCSASQKDAELLIAGHNGAHICNECVETSALIVAEKRATQRNIQDRTPRRRGDDQALKIRCAEMAEGNVARARELHAFITENTEAA